MDKTQKELAEEFLDLLYTPLEEEKNAMFIMVGKFFQTWATLESVMNTVIAGALNAKLDHWLIVTANLEVSKKIGIIRSFIAASSLSDKDKGTFDDCMNRIKDLSEIRNIIAHCMFLPHPVDGGAIFYRIKADKKLEQIEKEISKADFEKYESAMLGYSEKLGDLRDKLMSGKQGLRHHMVTDQSGTPLTLQDPFNPES